MRPWGLGGAWVPLPAIRVLLGVLVHHIDDVQHHQPHAQDLLLFHEGAPQASYQQASGGNSYWALSLLSTGGVPASQGLPWLLLSLRSSSRSYLIRPMAEPLTSPLQLSDRVRLVPLMQSENALLMHHLSGLSAPAADSRPWTTQTSWLRQLKPLLRRRSTEAHAPRVPAAVTHPSQPKSRPSQASEPHVTGNAASRRGGAGHAPPGGRWRTGRRDPP